MCIQEGLCCQVIYKNGDQFFNYKILFYNQNLIFSNIDVYYRHSTKLQNIGLPVTKYIIEHTDPT